MVPKDVADILGVAGATPVGEDEHDLAPQTHGDILLVVQQVLAVVLPEVGVHVLGARDHLVVEHRRLVFPQEAEDIVGAAIDRHLRRERGCIPHEGIAELLDLPGVGRVDQSCEALVAELIQEVRHGTGTFELTHLFISRPFSKGLTPHRPSAKRKMSACSRLLSAYLSQIGKKKVGC